MWLAGHTYAFRSLPLEAALDRLVGLGYHDVEVWLGHAGDDLLATARTVDAAEVRVRAVSAGGFYEAGDDSPQRAFALATALGADVVVSCVAPTLLDELVEVIPGPMRLAVENHWDQPLARSREVGAAIAGRPLGACLDTGHALAAGERPDAFAERLGARVVHVHLKEGRLPSLGARLLGRRLRRRFLGKPEPLRPGTGDLDIPALRAALAKTGFAGCVTAEHEGDDPEGALRTLASEWSALD